LRPWARERIAGLADATNSRRDAKVRDVLAAYVERIVVTPSTKSGVMAVNAHGGFGRWRGAVAKEPGEIRDILIRFDASEIREN